jgi:hypothetical protein
MNERSSVEVSGGSSIIHSREIGSTLGEHVRCESSATNANEGFGAGLNEAKDCNRVELNVHHHYEAFMDDAVLPLIDGEPVSGRHLGSTTILISRFPSSGIETLSPLV